MISPDLIVERILQQVIKVDGRMAHPLEFGFSIFLFASCQKSEFECCRLSTKHCLECGARRSTVESTRTRAVPPYKVNMGRFSLKRLFQRDDSDDDLSWLSPPSNVHDSAAWDRYWNGHVSNGIGPGLYDMMAGDPETAKAMAEMGINTVLCAGSGISQEPRALAAAGFEVTALDLSPAAMKLAQAWNFGSADLERFLAPDQRRTSGSAHFIVGDLLDLALCSGPFDMIIERCTLQNFPEEERGRALDALIARLTKNGIFLSHCHDGGWRPGREPFHPIRTLFVERGWTIWVWSPTQRPAGRSAWIYQTTG